MIAWRYLRLFGYFVRFSFSRSFEFRLDFFFRIIMDCIYYAVNISFYQVIFGHVVELAGWTMDQTMVFVAGFLLLDSIQMTLFSNNLWLLPQHINKGDLDYYLVRPVSSIFFVSLRDFAANSFVNFVIAIGIFIWALARAHVSFGMGVVYFLLIVNGTFLHYMMNLLSLLPVFWTHSGRGLQSVYWTLNRFMERPDRIFRGVGRLIMITILPFALMASFPARLILEPFNVALALNIAIVTVGLFVGLLGVWRVALRNYSSASS